MGGKVRQAVWNFMPFKKNLSFICQSFFCFVAKFKSWKLEKVSKKFQGTRKASWIMKLTHPSCLILEIGHRLHIIVSEGGKFFANFSHFPFVIRVTRIQEEEWWNKVSFPSFPLLSPRPGVLILIVVWHSKIGFVIVVVGTAANITLKIVRLLAIVHA